ncbi:hypothetical protein BGZ76_005888, partial [Entomortierella beljakovae]
APNLNTETFTAALDGLSVDLHQGRKEVKQGLQESEKRFESQRQQLQQVQDRLLNQQLQLEEQQQMQIQL